MGKENLYTTYRTIVVREKEVSDANPFPVSVVGSITVAGTIAATQSGAWAVSTLGIVSTLNSSVATLTSGNSFTGTAENAKDYAAITINVHASHDSAVDGLSVEWSSNGTDWDGIPDKFTVRGSIWRSIPLRVKAQFFRVKYTNGGTNQTSFRLQTVLNPTTTREELFTRTFEATLAISTSPAYVTGDALGVLITFDNAVPPGRLSGMIHTIILTDLDKENSRVDVVFFKANPSGTTFTDNSALDIADADLPKFIGHKRIEPADYCDFLDNSAATVANIGLPFNLDGGTSLYAVCVIRQGKTYTSTTDLTLKVVVVPGEN